MRILLFAIMMVSAGFAFSETVQLKSPNGHLSIKVSTDEKGLLWSLSSFDGGANGLRTLVLPSRLGLKFGGLPQYGAFRIVSKNESSKDTRWTNPLYCRENIRDHFNEVTVKLVEIETVKGCKAPRYLDLILRAYDEGVAFRYVVPKQQEIPGFQIMQELTEYCFEGNPEAWVTTYSHYNSSQESSFELKRMNEIPKEEYVGMPVLVKTNGKTVALTEAALSNWAGMYYKGDGNSLKTFLSPLPASSASLANVAVIRTTPAASPWRVAIVADNDLDLISKNDIILNLNPEPDKGLDFGWVKPGASSWDWWVESNNSLSTDLTMKLVDLAAQMGWQYHTIDGGWYGFARRPNHGPDVRIEPRPDFDLKRIVDHAAVKGVGIWVWLHWQALEDNGVDDTFAKLENWGIKGVKIDFHDRQDQWMVCWFEKVCRSAARHHIMVNFHGAFKPTGTERTWPNNVSREGIRGNEMCKFSNVITPRHCATLPYTRFLLGPGDFTPGSFGNVYMKDFVPHCKKGHRYGDENDHGKIWAEEIGTRAHSLALCIAYDSPLTTLCDWPERYLGADGIAALRSLPTVWRNTYPIAGECGAYYAVVREAYDGRFYFAALTDKRRLIDLKLDFLGDGDWMMSVFADDPELTPGDAKAIAVAERKVKRGQTISFELLSEGGSVAIFEKR